jgi:hypothetical protein
MKYPDFNIKELLSYIGDNPFILEIEQRFRTEKGFELSEFENEYLIKNYKFKPYEFSPLTIDIGNISEERLKRDFNLNRPVPKATINAIIGETDEWYHVRYKKSSDSYTYFWLFKEEVGDLYEKIYIKYPVDFEELNKNFSKGKLFDHQESAVQFLEMLHINFNASRIELLKEREEQQKRFDLGEKPEFPKETIDRITNPTKGRTVGTGVGAGILGPSSRIGF